MYNVYVCVYTVSICVFVSICAYISTIVTTVLYIYIWIIFYGPKEYFT